MCSQRRPPREHRGIALESAEPAGRRRDWHRWRDDRTSSLQLNTDSERARGWARHAVMKLKRHVLG